MPGDNFRVFVVSDQREHFDAAMKMFFTQHTRATHYCITEKWGMILFWTSIEEICIGYKEDDGLGQHRPIFAKVMPLPYEMDAGAATEFTWNYLKTADYGSEPDHDGDNGKGFSVCNGMPSDKEYTSRGFAIYNEGWGHVADAWQAICAVIPVWQMYGK